MSLKKQLINYFLLNKDAGIELLFFDEKLKIEKKKKKKIDIIENNSPLKVENKRETIEKSTLVQSIVENLLTTESELIMNDDNLYKFDGISDLVALKEHISSCQNCVLGSTRTNLVFGVGNPNADIMVIGEAPGADEDIQGFPFVGKAGKLLTDILKAIKLERSDVYIANICKCRPPGNRKPLIDEISKCEKYLHKQIELINPQFILALGLTAAEALFKQTYRMGDIRGKIFDYRGIKTLVTYHPAALLRNPNWKRPVWEDVQLLRNLYDEYLKGK